MKNVSDNTWFKMLGNIWFKILGQYKSILSVRWLKKLINAL